MVTHFTPTTISVITAAITTEETISGSTADQTLVNVNANQEPQLLSSNVIVTHT